MANPQESELHYPLGDARPAPGEVLEVLPGLRWLRMPLPFALDHINLWLLRDEHEGQPGWAIVDCGVNNEATRAAWEQVFAQHLDGLPVLRVIVTHFHPDHIGLADWLCERWKCRLWISATDYNVARMASQSTVGMGGESAARFFGNHGLVDPGALEKIRGRASYYPSMVPSVPRQFHRLMHGQDLTLAGQTWHCIVGHGHAPEHISLHCPALNVMISGDMVLPRISTNVSVVDVEPEADPLTLYLDSLKRLEPLPANTLVLPAHGLPFSRLHTRLRQLQKHHEDRLADVMRACSEGPKSAADLLGVLFKRQLDLHQTTFAMGESVAHLHRLWLGGQLQRRISENGDIRFAVIQSTPDGAAELKD